MRVYLAPVTTRDEIPVYFRAGQDGLFGIQTSPRSEGTGTWVVLVPGGSGTLDSMNRNRLWVRLARALGSVGCRAFRFDFHGAGESTGRPEKLSLRRPFTGDLEGAVAWIRGRGAADLVLVGSCFGARTALSGAPTIPDVRGLALIAPYVKDSEHAERVAARMAEEWPTGRYLQRIFRVKTIKGLLDPRRRRVYGTVLKARLRAVRGAQGTRQREADVASPMFLDPLEIVLERKIPVLLVFGDRQDATYDEFEQAKSGRLGEILERAGDLVEVRVLPGKVHGLRSLPMQDAVIDEVTEWLCRRGLARIE